MGLMRLLLKLVQGRALDHRALTARPDGGPELRFLRRRLRVKTLLLPFRQRVYAGRFGPPTVARWGQRFCR
ncbi:hypothetical protein ASG92_01635 [Arthrobacter sp. Soil736]|nr:hypothetical protein ASG92_01635 [Arthrobacter sp. Soil736]